MDIRKEIRIKILLRYGTLYTMRSRVAYPPSRLAVSLLFVLLLAFWTLGLGVLEARLSVLQAGPGFSEAGLSVLKARLGVLEAAPGVLEAGLGVLEARLGGLARFQTLLGDSRTLWGRSKRF